MERVFNGIKVCKGVHEGSAIAFFFSFPFLLIYDTGIIDVCVFLGYFNLNPYVPRYSRLHFAHSAFRHSSLLTNGRDTTADYAERGAFTTFLSKAR